MTKSDLKKKVYLAYGSRGLGSVMAGKVWHGYRNRKLADDISSTHRKQRENEVRSYKPSKPTSNDTLLPARLGPLRFHNLSLKSTTNWGSRIQIQEPNGVHFSIKPWHSTIPFSFLKYCHYFVSAKGLGQLVLSTFPIPFRMSSHSSSGFPTLRIKHILPNLILVISL